MKKKVGVGEVWWRVD